MRDAKIDCIVVAEEPGMDVDASLVCTVQFKGPSGQKLVRRFFREKATILDLVNFYKHETKETAEVGLFITYPKKDLTVLMKTLQDLNFGKQETVMVKYL